jgi:hypothetical protein
MVSAIEVFNYSTPEKKLNTSVCRPLFAVLISSLKSGMVIDGQCFQVWRADCTGNSVGAVRKQKALRRLKNMAKAKPVKKGKKLGSVKPLTAAFKR